MASKSHPKNVVGKNAPPAKKVAAPATVPVTVSETRIVTSFEFFVSLSASMRAMLVMTVPIGASSVMMTSSITVRDSLGGRSPMNTLLLFAGRCTQAFPSHLQIQDNMEYGL